MFRLRTAIPLLATVALLVVPAEASTTYYFPGGPTEAQFNTDTSALTLLNPALTFSSGDLAPGGLFNASGTGINFLGFDDFVFNSPTDLAVNSGKLTATQGSEVVKVAFPATGIYAFLFHITLTSGFGSWCVELTHGTCDYSIINTSPANVQYFGIVSTTPITAPLFVRNSGGNPTMVLPDFKAFSAGSSSSSEAPEPNSVLLAGLGLVIVGWMGRRKHRKVRLVQ